MFWVSLHFPVLPRWNWFVPKEITFLSVKSCSIITEKEVFVNSFLTKKKNNCNNSLIIMGNTFVIGGNVVYSNCIFIAYFSERKGVFSVEKSWKETMALLGKGMFAVQQAKRVWNMKRVFFAGKRCIPSVCGARGENRRCFV